ncbi:MAG: hypothetical protein JXR94_09285, partial [Candidatus Hydrogenedentes bacterium]|nr:hypothetical protein [Candidatus Hydrogenedentota bacterium]
FMLGVFGAVPPAAYAVMCLASSRFVSRAENGLNWAVFGACAFIGFYALVPVTRIPVVCCAALTAAIASLALVWPAMHSWIGSDPRPKVRARHMGLFNIAWSTGYAISPLLAGPLCDWDYRLPYVVLCCLAFAVFLIVRSLPHERDYFGSASQELLEERADHDRASEAHLLSAWCGVMVASALNNVVRAIYPQRIADLVAANGLRWFCEAAPADILTYAPATKFSWLASALAATTALSFVVMGRTERWHHRFGYRLGLQVAAAGAMWLLVHTESLVLMMASFTVLGANLGFAFFSGLYYSISNPARKHARAAINEGAIGMGGFAGSIVLGHVAGRYGLVVAFEYAPVFVGAALVLQALLLWHSKARMPRAGSAPL